MMGRLVEIKVWKEIVVSLFVCLTLSVGNGYAQSESYRQCAAVGENDGW